MGWAVSKQVGILEGRGLQEQGTRTIGLEKRLDILAPYVSKFGEATLPIAWLYSS
jgi:hypothetical protein